MRVLIACEYSATVGYAFHIRGHEVLTCDLLPSDNPWIPHYQGDIFDIACDGWDLMVAHPPCTYLCNSGVKHLVRGGRRINPNRWKQMKDGAEFFRALGAVPIHRIARENPIMHGYASSIIGCKADQFIQPYHYGHDVSKRTGFHLTNLPKLVDDVANHVSPRVMEYHGRTVERWANQSPCGADRTPPSADRGHKRSTFFSGVADAMAKPWGELS